MAVAGIVTNADMHDALLDTELQSCYNEYLAMQKTDASLASAPTLSFHQFVEKFGEDITAHVDDTADAVGRSLDDALLTDAQEAEMTGKFEADVLQATIAAATASTGLSLSDIWKRSGDKSYRANIDKRVQRDAIALSDQLEKLVLDDYQFKSADWERELEKRMTLFAQMIFDVSLPDNKWTALQLWLDNFVAALHIAADSAYKFKSSKSKRQTRQAFKIDPTQIGIAVRTVVIGKNDKDKNSWMQQPASSWKVFSELYSVNTKAATRLFSNLPPSSFGWLVTAFDAFQTAYKPENGAILPIKIGAAAAASATEAPPPPNRDDEDKGRDAEMTEGAHAAFDQAMKNVERKLTAWIDAGMPISADLLAESLAQSTAKLLNGAKGTTKERVSHDLLRINAAIQNAAYAAISKHELCADPLRHLMQVESKSMAFDSTRENNAFIKLTAPFIEERLDAAAAAAAATNKTGEKPSFHMWIMAPAALSQHVKTQWPTMTMAQRTQYVDSHTINESGLGECRNLLKTTSGHVFELDHAGRTLCAPPSANDKYQLKHVISVASPVHIKVGNHQVTLLPTGAEIVALETNCDSCGGAKAALAAKDKAIAAAKEKAAAEAAAAAATADASEESAGESEDDDDASGNSGTGGSDDEQSGGSQGTSSELDANDMFDVSVDTKLQDMGEEQLVQRWNDEKTFIRQGSAVLLDEKSSWSAKRSARRKIKEAWKRRERIAKLIKKKYGMDVETGSTSSSTEDNGELRDKDSDLLLWSSRNHHNNNNNNNNNNNETSSAVPSSFLSDVGLKAKTLSDDELEQRWAKYEMRLRLAFQNMSIAKNKAEKNKILEDSSRDYLQFRALDKEKKKRANAKAAAPKKSQEKKGSLQSRVFGIGFELSWTEANQPASAALRPMPSLIPLTNSVATAVASAANVRPMPALIPITSSAATAAAAAAAAPSTDINMFSASTFQILDRMHVDTAPWSWMREFVPESGNLCVFMPSESDVFNSQSMIDGMISVHQKVMQQASAADRAKYAKFASTVENRLNSVQYWAGIRQLSNSPRSVTTALKNFSLSRSVLSVLTRNQLITEGMCDWKKWDKELTKLDGQPLVLKTLSGAQLNVSYSFDAFAKRAPPRGTNYEISVFNAAEGINKAISFKPAIDGEAISTRNGYVYNVKDFFPANLSDLYSLIRDIDTI